MDIKAMETSVAKGYYIAGTTEEGHDYEAECYNVIVRDADGNTWMHNKTWYTAFAQTHHAEDGQVYEGFTDTRDDSFQKACYLSIMVEKVGVINLDQWTEVEPPYGSVAWQKGGY